MSAKPAALSLYRPLADARYRIVAFPHAGGGASAFMRLRSELARYRIELCPLQPPGRENRINEPGHERIEDAAAEFSAAITALSPLPTTYLGHSMGGLVAYLTQRLQEEQGGRGAEMLIVSASRSPARQPSSGATMPLRPLRDRILAYGGIPDAIRRDPALFELFETIISADIRLADAYQHQPGKPLDCPIMVYSGAGDREVPPKNAAEWASLSHHLHRTRVFEGGHFFLYENPVVTAAQLVQDTSALAVSTI